VGGGGGVAGGSRAHAVAQPHGLGCLALVDIEDIPRIEDAEPDRLAGEIAQAFEFGFGGAAKVELVPDAMGHLEQAEAEIVGLVALVDAQHPRLDESGKHPVGSRAGQAGAVGNFAETQASRRLGDDVEKRQATAQGLGPGDLAADVGQSVSRLNDGEFLHASAPCSGSLSG